MAITYCDNFQIYGGEASHMSDGLWSQVNASLVADPSVTATGDVLVMGGNAEPTSIPLKNLEATAGVAFRIYAAALPCAVNIGWFDDTYSNGPRTYLTFSNSGRPQLWRYQNLSGNPTLIATGEEIAITANAWWHCEIKCAFSTSGAGTFELRIEGETVFSETGLTMDMATPYLFGFNSGHSNTTYFKDLVIWDTTGSQNVDFLGSVIVANLVPAADIDFTWTPTPGGSPGYEILANAPPQDGVQYLDAINPPPAPYVCSLTSLSGDVTSIKAVMTLVRAAKTDGGDGSLQVGLISSPSSSPATGLGANRPITVAQTYWPDVQELDPKTAAPWLPSSVNTVQLQINRTT